MKRNLKVLGVALVAVLAMSAIAASASMASTPRVTTAEYPSTIEASQTGTVNELTLEGGRKVTCEIAKYTSEYTKAQSEAATWSVEFTPVYENCTATILGNVTDATVTVNGCKITANSETTVSTTEQEGKGNVNCPGSAKIEIHVWQTHAKHLANETALCTYLIGHQTNNVGPAKGKLVSSTELELNVEIASGIEVTRSTGTVTNCGAASQSGGLKTKVKGQAKKGGVTQTLTMDKE